MDLWSWLAAVDVALPWQVAPEAATVLRMAASSAHGQSEVLAGGTGHPGMVRVKGPEVCPGMASAGRRTRQE